MPVNPNDFVIKDKVTGLYCTNYTLMLSGCSWGGVLQAVAFASQAEADTAITQWGETPGARFVGQNPPPR